MTKRTKTAPKENSVEDVKKDELQQTAEETLEETGGETQGPVGPDGEEGSAGDEDGVGEDSDGEEPPASGSEDEGGVDDSGDNADDADAPETPAPIHTLEQLAAAAPVVPTLPPITSDKAEALINYIRQYVVAMDPTKYQDAKSGVPHQKRLYTMLVELMKLEFLDFKLGMDELLKLIFEYRHAAFSELYSRRFFENLYPHLTHAQVREFDDILSILVTVGAHSNRSRAMTQVDLGAALKGVKNAKSQQNMSAYFSALR